MGFDPPINPLRKWIVSIAQRRLDAHHEGSGPIFVTVLQSPCPFYFILRFLSGRESPGGIFGWSPLSGHHCAICASQPCCLRCPPRRTRVGAPCWFLFWGSRHQSLCTRLGGWVSGALWLRQQHDRALGKITALVCIQLPLSACSGAEACFDPCAGLGGYGPN